MPCKIVGGTKVPENEKSRKRKFLGTKGPGNESFQELSFPGNESSRERKGPGTKVLGNARERKFPGTKSLGNESSRELPGTKVNESSWNFRSWGTKVLHRDLSFLGTKGLGYEKSVIPLRRPNVQNLYRLYLRHF